MQWFKKYNGYQSVKFTQLRTVRSCPQPYLFLPPCFVFLCTFVKAMEYPYQFFSSMELLAQSWEVVDLPAMRLDIYT